MLPAKETASFQVKLRSSLKEVTLSTEIDTPDKGDGIFIQKTMIYVDRDAAFLQKPPFSSTEILLFYRKLILRIAPKALLYKGLGDFLNHKSAFPNIEHSFAN
jgi:hypothetical protein